MPSSRYLPRFLVFLALLTFAACGGGGGGGGGGAAATPVASLTSLFGQLLGSQETQVVDADARASFLAEITDTGDLEFAATAEPAWAADIIGMHIHRGPAGTDGTIVVDLLSSGATFDPGTFTASGMFSIDPALAAEIVTTPDQFYVNIHTSAAPLGLVRSQLGLTQPVELHSVMSGANETSVSDPDARGAATFVFDMAGGVDFVLAMGSPRAEDLTAAHIHVGGPTTDGLPVIGLDLLTSTLDTTLDTIVGRADAPMAVVAQILNDPAGFYTNVHTSVAPAGIARGQLTDGSAELWAPLRGDEEVTVVDPAARGGVTLELDSFTSGHVITAVPPAQDIDSVIAAHIHEGGPGIPGPSIVDLLAGSDYATSGPSGSAEGTITYDQTLFTRLLADPAAFYVNFHTATAPDGLVRGQLSRDAVTFQAGLNGAEEVPIADLTAQGSLTAMLIGAHSMSFRIQMSSPDVSTLIGAHIHDGEGGVNGPILIDLLGGTNVSTSGDTITGEAEFTGRTAARLMAGPELFYGNAHTGAAPAGVARGQLIHVTDSEPPADLVYTSPVTYQTGVTIPGNVPQSTGGAISSYTVSPSLPGGLSLDPVTGIISGRPNTLVGAADYTVTASNTAGSTTATVNITVEFGPPSSLRYTSPVTYTLNSAITPNIPTNAGGGISSYSVSPALPSGLSMSTQTGIITGTPNVATAAANYQITGTNSAGSTGFTLNLTVVSSIQAPSGLSYTSPVSYPNGAAIGSLSPTVGGGTPTSYTVSPALPSGLQLNSTTGVISGTPTTVTAAANYTVTASNSAGSAMAVVNITITLGAPTNLTYSGGSPNVGYVSGGTFATMTPSVQGGAVSSYSISPGLPAGIGINSTTGVISGTPTATSGQTTYTITATNSAGSTTAQISILVLP